MRPITFFLVVNFLFLQNSFVGLTNLGATCYVNTFLQVWFLNLELRQALYLCPSTCSDYMRGDGIQEEKGQWDGMGSLLSVASRSHPNQPNRGNLLSSVPCQAWLQFFINIVQGSKSLSFFLYIYHLCKKWLILAQPVQLGG